MLTVIWIGKLVCSGVNGSWAEVSYNGSREVGRMSDGPLLAGDKALAPISAVLAG